MKAATGLRELSQIGQMCIFQHEVSGQICLQVSSSTYWMEQPFFHQLTELVTQESVETLFHVLITNKDAFPVRELRYFLLNANFFQLAELQTLCAQAKLVLEVHSLLKN